jgi:nucleoid-associated protein YgaU
MADPFLYNRPRYTITFSADGIADVTAFLDATPAQVVSGYGGWTVLSRQRRVGLTQWDGKDPLRMSIPIIFDGIRTGIGQEVNISRLSRMGLPPLSGGEPPVVTWQAFAVPNPGVALWVIENFQWGTNVLWNYVGGQAVRVRQDCVVNLLEYRPDDNEAFRSPIPHVAKGKGKTGKPKVYTAKKGDTLSKIAQKFYGNASKWKLIADANHIRDPKTVDAGDRLRIPPG